MLSIVNKLAEKIYYTLNPMESPKPSIPSRTEGYKFNVGDCLKKDMYSPNFNQKLFTYVKIKEVDKNLRNYKVDFHMVTYNLKNGWFSSKDVTSQIDFGVSKDQLEMTDFQNIDNQRFIDGITVQKLEEKKV